MISVNHVIICPMFKLRGYAPIPSIPFANTSGIAFKLYDHFSADPELFLA